MDLRHRLFGVVGSLHRAAATLRELGMDDPVVLVLEGTSMSKHSLADTLRALAAASYQHEKRRRKELNAEFKDWAFEAVARGGKVAHAWGRSSNDWEEDRPADDRAPMDTQQTAEALLEEWGQQVWQLGADHGQPDLEVDAAPLLPRPSSEELVHVCSFFPRGTGLGGDSFHPRHLAMLPEPGLQAFIDICMWMEALVVVPRLIRLLLMVFIPKESGGVRPIGISAPGYASGCGCAGRWSGHGRPSTRPTSCGADWAALLMWPCGR